MNFPFLGPDRSYFMGSTKSEVGKKGEELALRHLKKLGYRIVELNYRCPLGEVDIVAREGDTLVFVEVKTRRDRSYGLPRDAVGFQKRFQLSKVAQYFLKVKRAEHMSARFDVMEVKIEKDGPRIELLKNAFELTRP